MQGRRDTCGWLHLNAGYLREAILLHAWPGCMAQTDGRRGGIPLPTPSRVITYLNLLKYLTFHDHRRSHPPRPGPSSMMSKEELVAGALLSDASSSASPPKPTNHSVRATSAWAWAWAFRQTEREKVAVRDNESRTKRSRGKKTR